ncbi:MAG TPA: MFS transporter [Thermoanaerobaculia bacterium]|nr:MFS transporter [Thermoanaerobaculia bacterium]
MEQPSDPLTAPSEPRPERLWNRNFLLLWQGQTISQLGNQAFSIAMMLWLKQATGSASLMGLLMFTSMIPGVLLGPIGGTFADRHSRIRIALICDILSALAVLSLAFAMFDHRVVDRIDPGAVRFVIGLMFVVATLLGILRAFFTPAFNAVIPDLVPREKIPAANSMSQISIQGSSLLGLSIGGVLFEVLGASVLYLVDGVSFLLAGLCAFLIRMPARQTPRKPATDHPFREFLRETSEGFHFIWQRPGLRDLIVVASVNNFLSMPVVVLAPFYVELYLKSEPRWYGFLMASIIAGSITGYVLAGVLRLSGAARRFWMLTSLLLAPAFFGALGLVRSPFVALGGTFLIGLALGIINVYFMSMLQMAAPTELRGRVLSVVFTLSGALMPVGMLLGGVLGDLTGKNVPLVYGVCSICGVLVVLVGMVRRELREFLASG